MCEGQTSARAVWCAQNGLSIWEEDDSQLLCWWPVPSRYLEWTVGSDISARASVVWKQHRCTQLGHGITETRLVAKKTHLKGNRNGSQI